MFKILAALSSMAAAYEYEGVDLDLRECPTKKGATLKNVGDRFKRAHLRAPLSS